MALTNTSSAEELQEIPNPGDVIAGKYQVQSVVGSGGMGVVLSARHLQLGQTVAIKVLRIGYDDERRAEATSRFVREGQAAATLETEHVVRVYDVGTLDNGQPFMVMELLRGADLGSLLQGGPLPVATAVEYVLQACDAIAKAHAQGIVHRDLKPSNLFATQRSDGSALIKVLDFGISKSIRPKDDLEGSLTSTRTVLGSPYYMSPEQIRDARKVDHRSDIWALGTILYELLTGTPAFEGDTLPAICAAIVADPPASLRARRPEVPAELEAVVMRCLEKDPARRIQHVDELFTALYPFSERAQGKPASSLELGLLRTDSLRTERGSLPGAETLPSKPPALTDHGSTLPSQDLVRPTPISSKRVHARTQEVVAISEVASQPDKPPRGAAIFVVVSLTIAALSVGFGLWSGFGSPADAPASAPSQALPQPALPNAPSTAATTDRAEASAAPAAAPSVTASATPDEAPAPAASSAQPVPEAGAPAPKPGKPKAKPAAKAVATPAAASAKPPAEPDIRLQR